MASCRSELHDDTWPRTDPRPAPSSARQLRRRGTPRRRGAAFRVCAGVLRLPIPCTQTKPTPSSGIARWQHLVKPPRSRALTLARVAFGSTYPGRLAAAPGPPTPHGALVDALPGGCQSNVFHRSAFRPHGPRPAAPRSRGVAKRNLSHYRAQGAATASTVFSPLLPREAHLWDRYLPCRRWGPVRTARLSQLPNRQVQAVSDSVQRGDQWSLVGLLDVDQLTS